MDFVGSNGTVVIPVDVTGLIDGVITITVTLTNGAGNSLAYTFTATKDTTPPPLSVSPATPYIDAANASAWNFTINGQAQATVSYTFSDGTTTISGGKSQLPASAKQNQAPNLTSLKDGNITLTVTETEASGNVSVVTMTIVKRTTPPAAPAIALNPTSDSGVSNIDWITNVTTPQFNVTAATGTTTVIYVNGTAYTGQTLANGSYTITAISTDAYGNTSATATAPKTLVIVTTPPSGSFTVSGAKTINGQLSTASKTPTLTLSFSDPSDSIALMAISTNGGATFGAWTAYASSATVWLANGDGLYTIVVEVSDLAGNTSAPYSLSVRLDTTGPTISASLSAPQNLVGYDGTADIAISASATDVSGIASTTLTLDASVTVTGSSIDIDTLTAGTHTLVVKSVDGLGNAATVTLTFQIHPTIAGIVAAVNDATSRGLITSAEKTTLLAILNSTGSTVTTRLNNFIAEVAKQSGKPITSAEATILTSWAKDDLSNRMS
jgi:hypothetical protein